MPAVAGVYASALLPPAANVYNSMPLGVYAAAAPPMYNTAPIYPTTPIYSTTPIYNSPATPIYSTTPIYNTPAAPIYSTTPIYKPAAPIYNTNPIYPSLYPASAAANVYVSTRLPANPMYVSTRLPAMYSPSLPTYAPVVTASPYVAVSAASFVQVAPGAVDCSKGRFVLGDDVYDAQCAGGTTH